MNSIYRYSFFWFPILFTFVSCVRDKPDNDCDNYVKFVYDYNMQFVDLFPQQASMIELYIFDEDELLLHSINDEDKEYVLEKNLVKLPVQFGKYTLIAWSGLHEESYIKADLALSRSHLHDFSIQVRGNQNVYQVDQELYPLWYGKLDTIWHHNSTQVISLVKLTNTFRIVMKNLDDENDIDVNDFNFIISSSNGEYINDLTPTGDLYEYLPYYTENNEEAGAIAELSTLRLVTENENTLEIIHKETGKNILGEKIDLNIYLNALRLAKYSDMPFQEYLDRECDYGIVLLYKGFNIEEITFASLQMQINGWHIREQDINEK